jgi:hypothetical protein
MEKSGEIRPRQAVNMRLRNEDRPLRVGKAAVGKSPPKLLSSVVVVLLNFFMVV